MTDDLADRLAIRDLIENWAVWRDAGDWERFRSCWHDDGVMMATWFQGPAEQFIRVTREGWARGVSILHFLGGMSIELAGPRATTSGVCDGSGKQIAGPFQEVNPVSLGLMGGGGGSVGVGSGRQVGLDLRYGMGLTKISSGSSARHSTIMLVATFEFGMNDQ